MLAVAISTLITRIRRRADLEGDTHVSDAELQALLSEQAGEMQMVVSGCGYNYFKTDATINLTTFALPTDHLSTIGVAFTYDTAGRRRPLRELMEQERNQWLGQTGEARVYLLDAQTIKLYPVPSAGTYTHSYIPQPTDYSASADSTTIDLVTMDGHAFVVEGVCAKALRKSETDVQGFIMAREEAKARLEEWAQLRSLHTPKRQMPAFDLGDGAPWDPADFRWSPP